MWAPKYAEMSDAEQAEGERKPNLARRWRALAEEKDRLAGELFHAAGAMHGALYFMMLDNAAFFAVNSLVEDVFVLTTTFTTYLTRPVSGGTLTAVGKVVNRNRTQFIAEAVVRDGNGKEIGRANGLFVRSAIQLGPEIGYA